jgi:hypothetical protein
MGKCAKKDVVQKLEDFMSLISKILSIKRFFLSFFQKNTWKWIGKVRDQGEGGRAAARLMNLKKAMICQ